MDNNRYVYVWKEQGIANSGLPFYVGVGTHRDSTVNTIKYYRAYQKHLTTGKKNVFAQNKADSLASKGYPHVVEILYDNLRKEDAMRMEIELIQRLGRRCNSTGVLCNIGAGGTFSPLEIPEIRQKHLDIMRAGEYTKNTVNVEHDGKVFNSKRELEKHLSITHHTLNRRIRNNRPLETKTIEYGGKIYKTHKELYTELGISKPTYMKMIKNNIPLESYVASKKKILHNSIIYNSIVELASILKVDRHLVSAIANGKKENKEIGEIKWLKK